MKLLIKLAWRSIWRNKRRTILTICAIVFATFFLILRNGMAKGIFEAYIKNIIKSYIGALQIQKPEYKKNPSIYQSFRYDEKLIREITQDKEIACFTSRIETNGLISYKNNSFVTMIIGISPRTEKTVTNLHERVKIGKMFESDTSNEIILGYKLLNNLGAKTGENLVILSQGFDGSLSNKIFKIKGAIKTGSEMDNSAIFMGLKTCQEFLGMGDRVNTIVLDVPKIERFNEVREELSRKINFSGLKVLVWDEIVPEIRETIEYDNVKDNVIFGILVVIVAFSILNTILMSITERFREFGIILSIGMQQTRLVTQIIFEALFITVIGILLGNVVGGSVNFYFYLKPLQLGGNLGAIYEDMGFNPQIEASLSPFIFLNTSVMIFIIFVIVCIYPLYKVYKLEPLKGIRYT